MVTVKMGKKRDARMNIERGMKKWYTTNLTSIQKGKIFQWVGDEKKCWGSVRLP